MIYTNFILSASALFTIVMGIISFVRSFKSVYDKERYEKIVFPLFSLMEPYLYRKFDCEVEYITHHAIDLIANQQMISGGRLTGFSYFYQAHGVIRVIDWLKRIVKRKDSKKNQKMLLYKLCGWCERKVLQCRYNNLCGVVCSEYDILCRRLGIPLRRFDYKLQKHQFRSLSTYVLVYVLI